MGGSFSPFHLGHLNSLLTVREQFGLEKILLIPSFHTPLKKKKEEVSPADRLEMLKETLPSYPFMSVDDQEILRKGMSYTYLTVDRLFEERPEAELFFIMGLDQFFIFDRWKRFEEILKRTNLIVTSRPGVLFPQKLSEFPKGLRSLIKKRMSKQVSLKKGFKRIYFCALKDMDISSSHIKKRIKEGKEVSHLLPEPVHLYIREKGLYGNDSSGTDNQTHKLLDFCAKEFTSKKAFDIQAFDLRSRPLPFSFGLIVSGANTRQTRALASHIKRVVKKKFDLNPIGEEGQEENRWIVFDYGDLVIHIFYDYTKRFYNLEELWSEPKAFSPAKTV